MFIDNFIKSLNSNYSFNIGLILFTLILVYCSITDIKEYKIYNKAIISLIVIRIGLIFMSSYPEFTINNIYGAIFGWLVLFIPAMLICFRMGGDIKLSLAIGFFLGVDIMPVFIGITLVSGILCGVIKRIVKKEPILKIPHMVIINNIMTGKLYNSRDIEEIKKEVLNETRSSKKEKIAMAPFFLIAHIILIIFNFIY